MFASSLLSFSLNRISHLLYFACGALCPCFSLSLPPSSLNMQRLLLTLVMLSSKFLDDYFCSNKQWAAIGDLSTRELNMLELHILTLLDFNLNITRDAYDQMSSNLEQADARTTSRAAVGTRQVTAEATAEMIKAAVEEAQAKAEEASSMRSSSGSIPKGPSPREENAVGSQQTTQPQLQGRDQPMPQEPGHFFCPNNQPHGSPERVMQQQPPAAARTPLRAIEISNDVELSSTRFGIPNKKWANSPSKAAARAASRPPQGARSKAPQYYDIPSSPVAPSRHGTPACNIRKLQGDATVEAQEFFDIPTAPMASQSGSGTPVRVQSQSTSTPTARSQYLSSFMNRNDRENDTRVPQQPAVPPPAPPLYFELHPATPRRAPPPSQLANISPWQPQMSMPRKSDISSEPTYAGTPRREYAAPPNALHRAASSPHTSSSSWLPPKGYAPSPDGYLLRRSAASPSVSVPHQHRQVINPGTPSRNEAHSGVPSMTPIKFLQIH